jgi:hypothetical protein
LPFENRRQRARKYARDSGRTPGGTAARCFDKDDHELDGGAGERTVKVWLAGSSGPSGEHLITLLCSSEAIFERVLAMAGRRPIVNRSSLESLKEQIADLDEAIAAALS